jgi:hypothetical protein
MLAQAMRALHLPPTWRGRCRLRSTKLLPTGTAHINAYGMPYTSHIGAWGYLFRSENPPLNMKELREYAF